MAHCILEANVYGVKVEGKTVKNKESVSIRLYPLSKERAARFFYISIPSRTLFSFLALGHEGRIGMAAVVLKEGQELDCSDVYQQVVNYLPMYARPRFIRIQVRRHLPQSDPSPRCTAAFFISASAALLEPSESKSCKIYYSWFVFLKPSDCQT